jgi:hypothetical protein
MVEKLLIDKIKSFLLEIEKNLPLVNIQDKKRYLEEYETFLIDSFNNSFSSEYSVSNIDAFFNSLDAPELIAQEFHDSISNLSESKETGSGNVLYYRIKNIISKKIIPYPVFFRTLLGAVFAILAIIAYNLTFATFRVVTASLIILGLFFVSYRLYKLNGKSHSTLHALLYLFLFLDTILFFNLFFEYIFVNTTGHFISQFVDKIWEPLDYSGVYFSFTFFTPYDFKFITALHPLFISIILVLMFVLTTLMPIFEKFSNFIIHKKQKRYYFGLVLVSFIIFGGFFPFGNYTNSIDFQPVNKIEGRHFSFGEQYSNPIRQISNNSTFSYPLPDGSFRQIKDHSYVYDFVHVRGSPVYTVGYGNSPILSETKYNASNGLSTLKEIVKSNYEILTEINLNLSIAINKSIITSGEYYYQNENNEITLFMFPYYVYRVVSNSIMIDKVYDILRNELVYYAQNRTDIQNIDDPTNAFHLVRSDLYRTYTKNELTNQFFLDIVLVIGLYVSSLVTIVILKYKNRK